jgi:predicted secreted protein
VSSARSSSIHSRSSSAKADRRQRLLDIAAQIYGAQHALRNELLALEGEDLDWGYLEAIAVLERRERTGGTPPDDVRIRAARPDSYDHR